MFEIVGYADDRLLPHCPLSLLLVATDRQSIHATRILGTLPMRGQRPNNTEQLTSLFHAVFQLSPGSDGFGNA